MEFELFNFLFGVATNNDKALENKWYSLYDDEKFMLLKQFIRYIKLIKENHDEIIDRVHEKHMNRLGILTRERNVWKKKYNNVKNEYASEIELMNTNRMLSYKNLELEKEIRRLKGE